VLDPADPSPEARERVEQWLRVQRALALHPAEAVAALRADPDPSQLGDVGRGLPSRPADLRRARRALAAVGARLVPYPSPAYPEALRRLPDAAPLLAVRGRPEALAGPCVALVGARAATVYGREMARRLAGDLARAGVVVVSGLARGIDAAAHEAALAAGGTTVAFQACGPDLVYPAEHRGLADRIAHGGAVVSELPPGAPPRKAHFPLRNRLISGVSRAVVVVEARARSGSLVTARHALDQGLEVLAVPGPVTAPTSEGTNALLRDGAAPALGADDVLRAAGLEPAPPPARAPLETTSAPADELVRALLERPRTRDDLARCLSLAPGALAARLLPLELEGRVAEDRDGRLRVVRATRDGAGSVVRGAPDRGLSSDP
jgi:DNA processing protein